MNQKINKTFSELGEISEMALSVLGNATSSVADLGSGHQVGCL